MLSRKGKPAPDIFLLALQRINDAIDPAGERVGPEDTLVFEDSIAGVEAGRKAGMRVVWCPHDGLREVCRGREGSVLEGATDHGNKVREKSLRWEGSEIREEEEVGGEVRSKDGRAEMLTSLVDFPYERFGIECE